MSSLLTSLPVTGCLPLAPDGTQGDGSLADSGAPDTEAPECALEGAWSIDLITESGVLTPGAAGFPLFPVEGKCPIYCPGPLGAHLSHSPTR